MSYRTIPIRMGKICKGDNSFAIKAEGYPIFGFGKTLGEAHAHWVSACYAHLQHAGMSDSTPQTDAAFEERLLVGNG